MPLQKYHTIFQMEQWEDMSKEIPQSSRTSPLLYLLYVMVSTWFFNICSFFLHTQFPRTHPGFRRWHDGKICCSLSTKNECNLKGFSMIFLQISRFTSQDLSTNPETNIPIHHITSLSRASKALFRLETLENSTKYGDSIESPPWCIYHEWAQMA